MVSGWQESKQEEINQNGSRRPLVKNVVNDRRATATIFTKYALVLAAGKFVLLALIFIIHPMFRPPIQITDLRKDHNVS